MISPDLDRRIGKYVTFILRAHNAGEKWVSRNPISLARFGEGWPMSLDPEKGWLRCRLQPGFFCFGLFADHHQCRLDAPLGAEQPEEAQ